VGVDGAAVGVERGWGGFEVVELVEEEEEEEDEDEEGISILYNASSGIESSKEGVDLADPGISKLARVLSSSSKASPENDLLPILLGVSSLSRLGSSCSSSSSSAFLFREDFSFSGDSREGEFEGFESFGDCLGVFEAGDFSGVVEDFVVFEELFLGELLLGLDSLGLVKLLLGLFCVDFSGVFFSGVVWKKLVIEDCIFNPRYCILELSFKATNETQIFCILKRLSIH
jgi:hypothetical protein